MKKPIFKCHLTVSILSSGAYTRQQAIHGPLTNPMHHPTNYMLCLSLTPPRTKMRYKSIVWVSPLVIRYAVTYASAIFHAITLSTADPWPSNALSDGALSEQVCARPSSMQWCLFNSLDLGPTKSASLEPDHRTHYCISGPVTPPITKQTLPAIQTYTQTCGKKHFRSPGEIGLVC